MDALLDPPPWFVAGPLLGAIVVAVLALLNERLGVVGGYGELVGRAGGGGGAVGWKGWFLVGIVAGGSSSGSRRETGAPARARLAPARAGQ